MSEHSLNINISHLLLILFFSQWTGESGAEFQTNSNISEEKFRADHSSIHGGAQTRFCVGKLSLFDCDNSSIAQSNRPPFPVNKFC